MLSLTTKSTYGIAAIMELAAHYGQGLIQIRHIVSRNNIPRHYLEQLFNRLIKAGIIKSVRGVGGGYTLNKRPDELTLFEVIKALEGELSLVSSYGKVDAVSEVFGVVEEALYKTLQITMAELLEKQHKYSKKIMFHI